jgi:hypothetical protein
MASSWLSDAQSLLASANAGGAARTRTANSVAMRNM